MNFKNLHKDKWQKVKLGEVALNVNESERNEKIRANSKFISVEHIDTDDFRIKNWEEKELPTFFRKFSEGDVLIALRRVYLRKVAIANFSGICSPHIYVFQSKPEMLNQKFLPFIFQNDKFFDFAISNSAGSISPYVYWKTIKDFQFLLPPLPEQKLISDILYKIEETIEQTEKQEKTLVEYRKEMVNTIFNHNEDFGTLLPKEKKKSELFGKVAKNIQKSEFNPLENGLTRFVGLEHIVTDNLNITSWGNIADGTTFTKTFKAGQILFGKRRAYLKKVAVASFEGLCSGDILVFDAIEKKILPELLPYLMQNDAFFEYAVKTSAGSLSPRTKWQDLVNFQFYLPDLKVQPQLVTLFKKIDTTIEQIRIHKEKLVAFKKGLLNELIG